MSTLKFKGESPYKATRPEVPVDDYLYARFTKDFNLENGSSDKQAGIALFGAGRAGTIHLHSLAKNPRVRLLYVVEDVTQKWDALKKYWNFNDTVFLTSAEADKVYKDPNVDGIVVTTPTPFHEGIVVNALENKKTVFCEKPIAQTAEATKKCYEKSKQVGKPIFAAFQRRFDPACNSAKRRVEDGEVGHIRIFKSSSKDSPMPPTSYLKTSGGIFQDSMIHDIDLMVWYIGEYPTTVSATVKSNIPEIAEINDYDTVVVTFSFPSGAIGVIDICRHCSYGYDQRLEIFGSKGMIRVDNQQPSHGLEIQTDLTGPRKMPMWYSFPSRYRDAYTNEMEHFINACQGLEASIVPESDVIATSKIASACDESAKTGKVVTLTW